MNCPRVKALNQTVGTWLSCAAARDCFHAKAVASVETNGLLLCSAKATARTAPWSTTPFRPREERVRRPLARSLPPEESGRLRVTA